MIQLFASPDHMTAGEGIVVAGITAMVLLAIVFLPVWYPDAIAWCKEQTGIFGFLVRLCLRLLFIVLLPLFLVLTIMGIFSVFDVAKDMLRGK